MQRAEVFSAFRTVYIGTVYSIMRTHGQHGN
jgi:hypothetical protein